MEKYIIYFKSGNQIRVEIKNLVVNRNMFGDTLSFRWSYMSPFCEHIDANCIEAIFRDED